MTTDPRDRDEADDLRAVSRAAADRLDERPSAAVRATVLAAAARATGTKPRDAALPLVARWRRWPMSVAAVLVVSVIAGLVATNALRQAPDRIATATPRPDSPATIAQADTVAPARVAQADAEVSAPVERTAPPAAAVPRDSRSAAKKPAPEREPARAARAAPEPRPAPPSQPAATRPAEPAPAPEPPHEASAAPSTPADAAEALAKDKNEAFATRAGPPAPRLALTDRTNSRVLTPQAWVERVVALRRAGRAEDADRELGALRRQYPEFEIPADALAPTGTR